MKELIARYKKIVVLKEEMGKSYIMNGLGECCWISNYALKCLFKDEKN